MVKTAIHSPKRRQRPNSRRFTLWAPSQAAVKIEFTDEVLREAARSERSVLYGTRTGERLRIAALRPQSGMELLGTAASRPRGEVFMTESDLELLERASGSVALVVAGNRAGFFVYEPDGTIQTIKSYQEFTLAAPAPKPRRFERKWFALAFAAALLAIPGLVKPEPPIGLAVREDSGQLRISWNPASAPTRLEINDGAQRDWIPVTPGLASATYVSATGDVTVRLIAGKRSETAHFVSGKPDIAVRTDIRRLHSEASSLRSQIEEQRSLAASLKQRVRRLK